ncbi:MAG: condensation domain-containing protein [Pseudomonadota bacterium]
MDQLDGFAGAAYQMEGALRLSGPLDTVVARHESLRTVFMMGKDGHPLQVIAPIHEAVFSVVLEDFPIVDEDDVKERVRIILSEPFDLGAGPLFRARLIAIAEENHILVVGGHHKVLNGWSVGRFLKEISALYREAVTGTPAALPELTIQYADFAARQRDVLAGDRLAEETEWWRETLPGIPKAITLPFDRPRPKVMDYHGGSIPVQVPADVTARLKALARSKGRAQFVVLEAALSALLSRLGAGEEVVIGTAMAGRPRPELENLAGFFVNTVALRNRVDALAPFREHL